MGNWQILSIGSWNWLTLNDTDANTSELCRPDTGFRIGASLLEMNLSVCIMNLFHTQGFLFELNHQNGSFQWFSNILMCICVMSWWWGKWFCYVELRWAVQPELLVKWKMKRSKGFVLWPNKLKEWTYS